MLLAFGEPPAFGVMKLASAACARISDAVMDSARATARRRRRWGLASEAAARKAAAFYPGRPPRHSYTAGHLRLSRAIRATAWALVAAGVAAPALRRRLKLPRTLVLSSAAAAPLA